MSQNALGANQTPGVTEMKSPLASQESMPQSGGTLSPPPTGAGAAAGHGGTKGGADSGVVEDIAEVPPVELDADTFGMSVCSLVRDSYFMSMEGFSQARCIRLIASIFLVVLTIGIQVFLLMKVKQFVSAKAVHDIRIVYDRYEAAMYGNHTTLTVNGKHRGIPGFMPPLAEARRILNSLPESLQGEACRIPLSQPDFFAVVLLIWTLTCFAELRRATNLEGQILMLKTVPSMKEAMRQGEDEESEGDGIIHAMTLSMKVMLTIVMYVPRLL